MSESIVRETDCVLATKQSVVGELVRCKDCKFYKTNFMWNGRERKVCVIEPYEPVRKPDDFCSRGEIDEEVAK